MDHSTLRYRPKHFVQDIGSFGLIRSRDRIVHSGLPGFCRSVCDTPGAATRNTERTINSRLRLFSRLEVARGFLVPCTRLAAAATCANGYPVEARHWSFCRAPWFLRGEDLLHL